MADRRLLTAARMTLAWIWPVAVGRPHLSSSWFRAWRREAEAWKGMSIFRLRLMALEVFGPKPKTHPPPGR